MAKMSQEHCFIYPFQKVALAKLKLKMLNWLRQFNIFAYLDNNQYRHQPNRFECIIAAGAINTFSNPHYLPPNEWLFGHLNYEFGHQYFSKINWTKATNKESFPDCFFFQPKIICYIPFGTNELHILCSEQNPKKILKEILSCSAEMPTSKASIKDWHITFNEKEYLAQIQTIKQDIRQGDYYEINFCCQATTVVKDADIFALFNQLNQQNPSPFASFYRIDNTALLSASPERFLYKSKQIIATQPIKGTIKRSHDLAEDQKLQKQLKNDIKERAENLMITDLMRNDLAKICTVGSINVAELLGLYKFPTLHHLISTIEGHVKENINFSEIIKATFPMGSMTGAPKKIVMERIDQYEKEPRGIYSGTMGYIMPQGDFDFNVVIRSLVCNLQNKVLQYATGGAITFDSIPEKEWQEVSLKAQSMKAIFQ